MSNTYGYCRISTPTQSLDRQERNIKSLYPNAIIFKEAFTGRSMDRPIWQKLYKALSAGDTVIFDEVSRMSRDADEGFALYLELFDKGINLIFLKESFHIYTIHSLFIYVFIFHLHIHKDTNSIFSTFPLLQSCIILRCFLLT